MLLKIDNSKRIINQMKISQNVTINITVNQIIDLLSIFKYDTIIVKGFKNILRSKSRQKQ